MHDMLQNTQQSAANGVRDITIGVAAHKDYPMPQDPMYVPLHVGAAIHPYKLEGFTGDDTGENISNLNNYFSELTGMYWLWKNCNSEYIGLMHYRRYLASPSFFRRHFSPRDRRMVTEPELKRVLRKESVVLPKKRNYYIDTIYSQYARTMYAEQLDVARGVLVDMHPDYVAAWDTQMRSRSAHLFNMMVMDKAHFDAYCEWLFPILFELQKRLDPSQSSAFHARYPGRVSERLLDVWINTNHVAYAELPTTSPEPVNWVKKGGSFILSKLTGKKYVSSF